MLMKGVCVSDIIKVRQLIENGYSVIYINIDNYGQAVIKFTFTGKGNPIEGKSYFLTTQDQAVIQKVPEIIKNNKLKST